MTVYTDFKSSFNSLLMIDNSFSIYERNIQGLAIEIWTFLNGLSPSIWNNVFHKNISNSYDLRNHKEHHSRNLKRVRYETEIWSKAPETIKISLSFEFLKSKIQIWKPECNCHHCTKYFISHLQMTSAKGRISS